MSVTPGALSQEAREYLRDVFKVYDPKNRDTVPLDSLGDALRAAGQNPTEEEVHEFGAEISAEGRETVDFPEFLIFVARKMNDRVTEEDLKAAFRVFDRDGKGYITSIDFRMMMCHFGDKLSDQEMGEMLNDMQGEVDAEGNVNYDELVRRLMPESGV